MRVFLGKRAADGEAHVSIQDGESITELSPSRSQDLYNHSPTGFNWGYGGSGPSQLALARLREAIKD